MNNYITTFREQKHRGVPTPMIRRRKPMPLEITTFRVAFVHTNHNLIYELRELILSLLRTIALLKFFRLVCGYEQKPLLVTTLILLSPKVSNQTDNGLTIYIMSNNFATIIFFIG
tara:strand:- start:187 stop:531 length:345 start_codon:yes stop_codon:yes gene_type:complete